MTNSVISIITILTIVILAIFICAWSDRLKRRGQMKKYLKIQSEHLPLSDEVFCKNLQLDSSLVRIISIIRNKLAEQGRFDALRVYPQDTFYPNFGLAYDDDVAMFVQDMKIIESYRKYYFPLEEVQTVGDFVKVVLRLKKEFEEPKISQR